MRYQERIYNQADIFVRNKAIHNVNMSSDFCIFKSPTFDVEGATKVPCNSLDCTLTGYSFANMLTAATITCYPSGNTSCHLTTNWQTKIIADSETVYESVFYTTVNISGDTPSSTQFINSVKNAYNSLDYSYVLNDTTFTIDKPYGVRELELDVCVIFDNNETFVCPAGFSATPANDSCEQVFVTATTYHGSGATIVAGNQDSAFANYGTYFYPSIQNNGSLPVYYIGNFQDLRDQSGGTITALNINNIAPFWGNPSVSSTAGRLNNVGLSAATLEYVGFTKCIDIAVGGTYYLGIAADNNCKFTVNGILYAEFSGSQSDNFKKWSVFPFQLSSGKNIIEMYGENTGLASAFGAEIYNPIGYSTLTGATATGSSGANVIFSTKEFVGGNWQLGSTVGYTCPAGYALDSCNTAYTCTKIVRTGATISCSGTCNGGCTEMCGQSFNYIDNTSTGVYLVEGAMSTIPVVFNFTGDTDVFSATNASFKFEVYKFNPTSNIFVVPPVYRSTTISYGNFSNSMLQQNIPISALTLDGDYLIKGYYEANACTDFLNRLGKRIDTMTYKQGSSFQLYEADLDYYFVAVNKAEVPTFTTSPKVNMPINNQLPLYQQAFIVNDSSPSGYTRTGSTFTLDSEYVGEIFVTLNGATLAENYDYTFVNNNLLTFSGSIITGDVITIVYTKSAQLTIVAETIIVAVIPSGVTGDQGSSNYYYNTSTGKYEIYTQNQILNFSNAIVMVQGSTLLSNVDYYQSISDRNRIILNGSLTSGDTVIIVYYPLANVINGITQNNTPVSWSVLNAPQLDNGLFNLQYSTGTTFSSYTISDTVEYEPQVNTYTGNLLLVGTAGTQYYYRVQNIKSYRSICGDIIGSTAYSETVGVVINSNSINSY